VPGEGHFFCENRGSGIGAMLVALRGAGMSPPEFKDAIATFSVTFPNHTLFDQETLRWLGDIGADYLSDNQRVGLALLRNGQSLSNEVYRKFNDIDSRVATKELRDLVDRELIRPVSSGRWTTYRLTDEAEAQGELEIELPTGASDILPEKATAICALLGQKGELSSSEIAEALGLPGSTTRFWLKRLRGQGLVEPNARNLRDPNLKYRLPR
jgi:ATP-dependent DNA helicase RecG